MAILAIAGVPLPVLVESLSINGELVGSAQRNANGWRMLERRAEKLVIDFSLGVKPLDEMMLYRELILARGEFFDTILSVYGSKGWALSGTGAWSGSGGGNPNNGNGTFLATSGQTMVIPGRFYDQSEVSTTPAGRHGATAVGWMRDESSGNYRVFGFSWRGADTTATVKREALGTSAGLGSLGTPQAWTGTHTFSVSSGNLTVTMPAASFRFSNILVLPRYFAADQVDRLISGRNLVQYTMPVLPRIYVQTDLFPLDLLSSNAAEDLSIICHGEVSSMPVVPSYQAGVFTKTTMGLQGRLIEV